MTSSRRDFLKIAGASALTMMTPAIFVPAWAKDVIVIPPGQGLALKKALAAGRWAMTVDLTKCTADCTDCIAACHAIHNVPDFGNPKDEIKWIWKESFASVFPGEQNAYSGEKLQKLRPPVFCNNCENPPCVRVCPTGATFQRPDGIVMMDYHRCIGCRLCMAACPYDARYYCEEKGAIDKCDFCFETKLSRGEKTTACSEACPADVRVFGDLSDPHDRVYKLVHQLQKPVWVLKKEAGAKPNIFYMKG